MKPFNDGSGTSIIAKGPKLILNPKAAEQIGLALHELGTNAVKHGALSVQAGSVRIGWEFEGPASEERMFRFTWKECGGPPVSEPQRHGFGLVLITKVVPSTLQGTVTLRFERQGLTCDLLVPAENVLPIVSGVTAMAMARSETSPRRTKIVDPASEHM
jgi:two-component sensor histidine kinase